VKGRDALLVPLAIQIDNRFIWELLDWSTILFEVGFLAAVWRPKWFKFFLVIAVFFHFSTQLLMNISFLHNFLAYSAFLNWHRIYNKINTLCGWLPELWNMKANLKPVLFYSIVLVLFFGFLKWFSLKDILLHDTDLMVHESIFLFLALLIVFYISYNNFSDKLKKFRSSE
jgi:hypothetical protein